MTKSDADQKDGGKVEEARYWLMKSEPDAYSWDDLVAEGEGTWDGVRNHRAANNLRAMKKGDKAFFYHSNEGLEIVGIVTISKPGLKDPSDPDGKWAAVKVKPVKKLKRAVTLKEIKADPALADMELVRQSRLSVAEVRPSEWDYILAMAKR
jgi:predicted RNA-binding protein with PUA-like domain